MQNTNRELLGNAVAGDINAFRKIVQEHQLFVYRAAFRLLANEEDARDATQECFVRVWRNLHKFDMSKKFTTWLYKIIVNICYDDLRRAYKKQRTSLEAITYQIASDCNIEKETADSDLARKICTISKQLKPQQRMVFALRDLQDLDMQEISEILSISIGAVKSNLFYARKNIRKKMHEMGYLK